MTPDYEPGEGPVRGVVISLLAEIAIVAALFILAALLVVIA
ncbi:hypothetical protein [Gordonia sp. WA4-43]|nr:hypothetical protein [Gordonia sp. WA4-43]